MSEMGRRGEKLLKNHKIFTKFAVRRGEREPSTRYGCTGRYFGSIATALVIMANCVLADTPGPFTFDTVVQMAREAAAASYADPTGKVPSFLMELDYDHWRDIRFDKQAALWRGEGLKFTIEFFHLGFYYDRPVAIHTVRNGRSVPVPFSTRLFNYGENSFAEQIPGDLGFAGFRIHLPLRSETYYDEAAVFLGASYFRAISRDTVYGLSARGLAIDTASANGEEFPYFKSFWLVQPERAAEDLTIYALLDSPSLTGAYRFLLHPGSETTIDVSMMLFLRADGKKFGLAPLTSMFYYSEGTNQRPVDDFRPEIHDSDGLLIAYPSGEYVWRPLINPDRLFVNAFEMQNPAGFGLQQRDMTFDHYQDQEARYDIRPSVWVQPLDQWGRGRVELVQIPTKSEKNDNIVAYWVPALDSTTGIPSLPLYRYRLTWTTADRARIHPHGYVVASRTSAGKEDDGQRRFIVDFSDGALANLPDTLPSEAPLEAVVQVDEPGEITGQQLYRIPDGSWRLVFDIRLKDDNSLEKIIPDPNGGTVVELRAHLKQGQTILTETWSYAFLQ